MRIIAESTDTVTISRDDWEALQDELQELQDCAAVAERRAYERLVGKENARRDYLTGDEAIRLLNGESPLKVWREKRGLSQRALAAAGNVANGYLAEIETGRKPGSDDALRKLAAVLLVSPEDLDARRYRMRDPEFGPVQLCFIPDSAGVAPGHHLKLVGHADFATLGRALDFVRKQWSELRSRSPWVTDTAHRPIYTSEELFREFER